MSIIFLINKSIFLRLTKIQKKSDIYVFFVLLHSSMDAKKSIKHSQVLTYQQFTFSYHCVPKQKN